MNYATATSDEVCEFVAEEMKHRAERYRHEAQLLTARAAELDDARHKIEIHAERCRQATEGQVLMSPDSARTLVEQAIKDSERLREWGDDEARQQLADELMATIMPESGIAPGSRLR